MTAKSEVGSGNTTRASGHNRLEGRIAFVTGASRGIGRSLAQVLAREGARVVLAARSRGQLDELAEAIAGAGGAAFAVDMDVTSSASVARAFSAAVAHWGVPTVIVNNAGVAEMVETLRQSEDSFDHILATNLRGPWLVAREAAKHMVAGKTGGSIVNVASILGLRQGGQVTAYAATKAALVQMTKQLALEWARHGIRVNALAPGYVETDLNRDFFGSEKGLEMIRRIPMRQLVQLEDLAEPLMLFAGDGSARVTGTVLPVDGGHLLASL
jgi:NAD(P)-dependent dehydrogenase (short-subunit alcohol dehydrogenase family)